MLIKIELPEYAIRYLRIMCKQERDRLNYGLYKDQAPPSLQEIAAFDSLDMIECALPCE